MHSEGIDCYIYSMKNLAVIEILLIEARLWVEVFVALQDIQEYIEVLQEELVVLGD